MYLVLAKETHWEIWESIEKGGKNEELSRKDEAQEKFQQTRLVWLEEKEKLKWRSDKFLKILGLFSTGRKSLVHSV